MSAQRASGTRAAWGALAAMIAAAGACAADRPIGPDAAEIYQRPAEHSAPRRIGGAGRAASAHSAAIAALVPDHLGLTAQEQPTLYWVMSAPGAARVEIVLNEPERETPLIELSLDGSRQGVHALDLRAHAVRLVPGIQYEWSVAIVVDPQQRAQDVVSGGAIMRIEPASASPLATRWYDMLADLVDRLSDAPRDAQARERLASLLEQVGLGGVPLAEAPR